MKPSSYDELIYALRHPSKKMLDAMASAMSPGKRPTQKEVSAKEKHRIRFAAAINVLLGDPEGGASE